MVSYAYQSHPTQRSKNAKCIFSEVTPSFCQALIKQLGSQCFHFLFPDAMGFFSSVLTGSLISLSQPIVFAFGLIAFFIISAGVSPLSGEQLPDRQAGLHSQPQNCWWTARTIHVTMITLTGDAGNRYGGNAEEVFTYKPSSP